MTTKDGFAASKAQERAMIKLAGSALEHRTPIPPHPVVPPDVTRVGLPDQSDSVVSDGNPLDYLPIAVFCNSSHCVLDAKIGGPIFGIMTPSGEELSRYEARGGSGDLLYVLMAAPNSPLGAGTIVREKRYWQRLTQAFVPENTPHTFQLGLTEGITETESQTLSFTVGAKVAFSKVIDAELSASLTRSFSYQVSISTQRTFTEIFNFPALATQQVDAVYQLMRSYEVVPGPNLANFVQQRNLGSQILCLFPIFCVTNKAELPFSYPGTTFLQVAATNKPGVRVDNPMLTPDQIDSIVRSIEIS
jgi:hypothetical protein